jgi:MFS family permease
MRTVFASLSARLASLFEDSPLRKSLFRRFYFGTIGAALGYVMQSTIAAWVMATLTPSPFMVAMVQSASTAPSLIVGLIAGTMADIVDRRKLIVINMIILASATALLGLATLTGLVNPALLLFVTFIVGAAFTFYQPAQSASVNDMVSREELPRAIALSAVAFNVARAIGPALAGVIAAWLFPGTVLIIAALCFGAMIIAAWGWNPPARTLPGVPETLMSGVLTGLRYTRHSIAMRAMIVRSTTFTICATAIWALLPVIARDQLQLGAGGYGLLFAGFGTGAVIGALSVPHALKSKPLNTVVSQAVILWALATFVIAATEFTALALLGTACAGVAWVNVHACLSAGLQSSAPGWVRARAVAVGLISVQASMAVGSLVWGAVASTAGLQLAMALSGGMMLLLYLLNRHVQVRMGSEADVTPGAKLPTLTLASEPEPDDGPVLIQIEYRIEPDNRAEFLRIIQKVGPIRRRNGATSWRVFRNLEEENVFVERYVLESWAEYVRQRSRMTVADRAVTEAVELHQKSGVPLRISRLIGVDPRGVSAGISVAAH